MGSKHQPWVGSLDFGGSFELSGIRASKLSGWKDSRVLEFRIWGLEFRPFRTSFFSATGLASWRIILKPDLHGFALPVAGIRRLHVEITIPNSYTDLVT